MNADNGKIQIAADFGEEGGAYTWPSWQDLLAWTSNQLQEWSWLNNFPYQGIQNASGLISNGLNSVIQLLHQAVSFEQQNQIPMVENYRNSALEQLKNLIRPNPWILNKSAKNQFLNDLRNSGKTLEAATVVVHWLSQDANGVPIRSVVQALLLWELYDRGIKDRVKTESASLKRLAGEMQTCLSNYQESERSQTQRFDELDENIKEQINLHSSEFKKLHDDRQSIWDTQLQETQDELDRLKDTYDKHMALAAPVEYWDAKRKKHNSWVIGTFIALIVAMIAAGLLLHWELHSVGQAVEAAQIAKEAIKQANVTATPISQSLFQFTATWHIGSFLLLATLCFWVLRLIVRVFLSNMHLENDAAERVTMAKTYLALIRDGNLPKGENINTVLAALFRPTGDGIVKDEGVPPTTLDWFTKIGGK